MRVSRGAKGLCEQGFNGLEAPADLKRRIVTATFKGIDRTDGLRITVSPDAETAEITTVNNAVTLEEPTGSPL